MALSPKQKLFVQEYLRDQNGTRAVMAAGYTQNEKAAGVTSTRLLKNASVKAAIDAAVKERVDRVKYQADDVLRELQNIADADIALCYEENGDVKPIHQIPLHVRKAIAGIDVEVKYVKLNGKKIVSGYTKKLRFWDKTKALELSGKHMKLFTDKIETTGKDGAPLTPAVVVVLPPKNEKPS